MSKDKFNNKKDDEEEIIVAEPVDPPVPEGPELDLDDIYEDEKE